MTNYYVYPDDPELHNGETIQEFTKKGEYQGEVHLHELSPDTEIHLIRIPNDADDCRFPNKKKVKKLLKYVVVVSIQRFKGRYVLENHINPYKAAADLAGWTLVDSFFTTNHSYWVMKFVKDDQSRCCVSYIANGKHILYAINEEQYDVERTEYEWYLKDEDPMPEIGKSNKIETGNSSVIMNKLLEKVRQKVAENKQRELIENGTKLNNGVMMKLLEKVREKREEKDYSF
jgi:hypothetical protein